MAEIVLGIIGPQGSGKGAAAEYLTKRYNAQGHRYSTSMRAVAKELGIPDTRENLVKIAMTHRKIYGADFYSWVMTRECAQDTSPLVVIEGIRMLDDAVELMKQSNFRMVHVDAPAEVRYRRIIARGENAGETGLTFEQFLHQENTLPTEIELRETAKKAHFTIDNSGNALEPFHEALEETLARIREQMMLRSGPDPDVT